MLVKEFEREQEQFDVNVLQEHNIEPNYFIDEPQLYQDTPLPNYENQTYSQAISSPSQATPSPAQVIPSSHATPSSSQVTPSSSQSTPSSGSRRSKRIHKSPNSSNQSNHKIQSNNLMNLKTQKIKKVPLKHYEFKWKKSSPNFNVEVPLTQEYLVNEYTKTPLEYFLNFFSDDIFNLIVEQTNLYSFQKFNKSVCTSVTEIKDLIGIMLIMGIVKMPAYSDYWSPYTRYSQISNVMSLKRYKQLMRCLHFCNNEETDDTDRFFKVRQLIDMIRINCLSVPQGKRFSIDEMMVPYKGKKAGSRKQYMKNKPKKWGFKLFVRAGIDGMVYDFLTYSGESTFRNIHFSPYEISYFGLGPKVVIALCSSISDKPLTVVYFDNFFTTPELISYLRSKFGILSLGTLRKQHLRGCPLIDDKTMLKKSRGSFTYLCDNSKKVSIVKWLDNKIVCLASSYTSESTQNTNFILRYSKETKKKNSCAIS